MAGKKTIFKPIEESEVPFKGCSNWTWVRLNQIYNFIDYRGKTPKKLSDGVPLVTAKNVRMGYMDYSVADYISNEEYEERQSRGISKKGDILFTTEAPLGNVALADLDVYSGGQRLITFQKYKDEYEFDNKFFFYYMLSDWFQGVLHDKKTGNTVEGIKAEKLKQIPVPFPPISEQKRIVEQIEKLFAKLDEAKEKAIDALDSVEIRKKAIYSKAFNGELSKSWRSEKGIENKEWETIPFEKVVINKDSVRIPLSQSERDNIAKIYDYYGASGVIDKVDNYLFDGKYLLIGEDGANLVTRSKPIAFIAQGKFWVNNHAHIFEMKDFMDMDYLCHYINSIDLIPYVTGSAQPKLSQKMMNKIPVIVPSLEEQVWITTKVNEMFLKEDEVETNIEKFIETIELMKKSILAKAFRGELGTNIADEESSIELLKQLISD